MYCYLLRASFRHWDPCNMQLMFQTFHRFLQLGFIHFYERETAVFSNAIDTVISGSWQPTWIVLILDSPRCYKRWVEFIMNILIILLCWETFDWIMSIIAFSRWCMTRSANQLDGNINCTVKWKSKTGLKLCLINTWPRSKITEIFSCKISHL